ncbi:ABC transporter substrate-binding protein [Streptomyces sp. NPDC090994]|uniref:ABC transporter substrate-binding protein n=1 Tax=Streptomyces sp. NPDC090994 TaxID=3365969 RepID=UPI00382F7947
MPAPEFWPRWLLFGGASALVVATALVLWWVWHAGVDHRVRHAVAAVCAVVAGGAVAVVCWTAALPDYCQSGNGRLVREDGQCVGISDGGYVFDDALAAVSARIEELNDRVEQGDTPYATIALMIPMTPGEESAADRAQVLREVQGAYLAQYRADVVAPEDVPVRLVLANPGRDLKHGRRVADWLAELAASDEDRLRAVFGFNLSVQENADTIGYLTREKKIPVVGGPLTATGLADGGKTPYPGLVKVVPSNHDQARALRHYLDEDDTKSFLIEDISGTDLYAKSLREAFREVTRNAASGPEQYDAQRVTNNDFQQMVNNICDSRATTLYFAGRPAALAQLINALGRRGCTDRHLTLVTVSGASTITLEPSLDWSALTRGEGLTVEYATITHPDVWAAGGSPAPPSTGGSPADLAKLTGLLEPDAAHDPGDIGATDLSDGRTITMYDAALTAITGIENRVTEKGEVPDLAAIGEAWRRLHGVHKVPGASGWICLRGDGTPYDKAVAIVRLVAEGGEGPGGHLAYQGVAWPTGRPLTAERCLNTKG